jgi:hypothetical protein
MKLVWSIAMALSLLPLAARGEDASADVRRAVREALAERAMVPVAPPVLPVLLPGQPGEPAQRQETHPRPEPAPGKGSQEPARPGTPAPGSPQPHGGPPGHGGAHGAAARSAQSEAVGVAAREAHRIRADAANRAAMGATVNGAAGEASHGSSDCHDAASHMRTMGMDPEHASEPHHGGMMPDGGSTGGTMPGGHQ